MFTQFHADWVLHQEPISASGSLNLIVFTMLQISIPLHEKCYCQATSWFCNQQVFEIFVSIAGK